MPNFNHIFLARHGEYADRPEQLTVAGVEQATRAAHDLADQQFESAIVLSSTAPRAMETAKVFAQKLGTVVVPSVRMNVISNFANGVESLDAALDQALEEAGAATKGDALIVVAHQPLLKIASFGGHIAYGAVIQYQAGTWENPEYTSYQERIMNHKLDVAFNTSDK